MLPCDGEGWEQSCSSPITPCCSSLLGFSIPKSPREHDVVPGWQGPRDDACPLRSPGASGILSQPGSCSGGAELLLGCAPRAGSAARLGPVCAPWQLAMSRQTDGYRSQGCSTGGREVLASAPEQKNVCSLQRAVGCHGQGFPARPGHAAVACQLGSPGCSRSAPIKRCLQRVRAEIFSVPGGLGLLFSLVLGRDKTL